MTSPVGMAGSRCSEGDTVQRGKHRNTRIIAALEAFFIQFKKSTSRLAAGLIIPPNCDTLLVVTCISCAMAYVWQHRINSKVPTMAGLSQNVLNMKFMKGGDNTTPPSSQPITYKRVKDPSEWFLPNRGQVQQKIKPAIKVSTVGYGSIASFTAEDSEGEKEEAQEEKPAPEKDKSQEADEFLKDIMGKSKKGKKRKAEKSERSERSDKPQKKSKKQKKQSS